MYFELFDDGDDGEVEVAKPGETEEGQEGRRERGFVRTSRVRPQQTPDITLQLLNQRGSLTGALPLATPQEAASLAASCGFYTPGTPVDVWVRDGWWMAHIVREVAPEAVVDSRSSKPSSTGRRCASDVALAQISPGGRAWQATIDPDRMLTLDIKDGALDRIFEVRWRFSQALPRTTHTVHFHLRRERYRYATSAAIQMSLRPCRPTWAD